MGFWIVQERLPFHRAIGKESDASGDTRSVDDKDDGGGAEADGRRQHV
jgi:hypothetical protein